MVQTHEVNKRIMDEIKICKSDEKTKQFVLEVLDFELEHFDERAVKNRIRFKDDYERIIERCCQEKGE